MKTLKSLAALLMLASACGHGSVATPGLEAATADGSEHASAGVSDLERTLAAVARDIETLKADFPQLADYSPDEHFQAGALTISYGYRTHRATHAGGWTAGVPNPDADGVWFHIDFHAPDSTAQIHTQPVTAPRYFRDKKVTFLILEGADTKKLAGALDQILVRHGVTTAPGR